MESLKNIIPIALGIAGYLILVIWVLPRLGFRT
jgi:hypothetical protein